MNLAIEAAVRTLQQADLSSLRSAEWLEHVLLPQLGLSDVAPHCYPKDLQKFCGLGIRSFQQPNQFSKYLAWLSAHPISSYLEVGVWQGGTFIITVEYLSRFNPNLVARALDITIQHQMIEYAAIKENVSIFEIDSKKPQAKELVTEKWWDLAFIDGDHTAEGCFNDFSLVRDNAGMIALHDIYSDHCPGVGDVWRRISDIIPKSSSREFIEQYPEVLEATAHRNMGIGIVQMPARSNVTSHSDDRDIALLVAIPFLYRRNRLGYLTEVLRSFSHYPLARIDFIIMTTNIDDDQLSKLEALALQVLPARNVKIDVCKKIDHPLDLTWEHKKLIEKHFREDGIYTHFIYTEDDTRIEYPNFKYFMEMRELLRPHGLLPGFLRVEYNNNVGRLTHVDNHESVSLEHCRILNKNGLKFANLPNPYFSCLFLDKELAQEHMASISFSQSSSATLTRMGIPERAAMGPCFDNIPSGYTSRYVMAIEETTGQPPVSAWISHLPDTYALNDESPFSTLPIEKIFSK